METRALWIATSLMSELSAGEDGEARLVRALYTPNTLNKGP